MRHCLLALLIIPLSAALPLACNSAGPAARAPDGSDVLTPDVAASDALGDAADLGGPDDGPAAETATPDVAVSDARGDAADLGGPGDGTAADTSPGETAADTAAATITVSGTAFAFSLPGQPYGRIGGATITILEHPGLTTTTAADGSFVLAAVPAGTTATFVLVAAGFPEAQTKTFSLPAGDLERVTFQVPDDRLFGLMAQMIAVDIDPAQCQLVTTVTRVGKSIYDEGAHGEAGALVAIEPALPAENGPIYFNENVIPDRAQPESSEDGGVLFVNVPPGTYTLRAEKAGVPFEAVTMTCRPGVLVNASPPYGLQALAP